MSTKPALKAPPGACDCHIHFYGPEHVYPVAPTSPFPVPHAPVEAYRGVMARLGLERVVIVQPSSYAKDNTCIMDAAAELGDAARTVVVVDDGATDDDLGRLTEDGARGIRFHMLAGGVLPWELLEPMAARVQDFGWHVQLQMDGRDLAEHETMLRRLPGDVVIDHTGKFLEPPGVEHSGFRSLLRLVEAGRTWVKLSAPYETSKEGPPYYEDVGRLARALIAQAPERMVWASNWPHPSAQDNPPDDAALFDVLRYWADSDETANRILVDNPAALYGF